jgi:hypothetical protein
MIATLIITGWCGTLAMQPPQPPPRDTRPRTAATATASISGTVVSDEAQPRKLRRVRVTVNGAVMETGGRTVITDDDGRYQFSGLPPGQYGLTAVKDGYIAARYGSGRPPRLTGGIRNVPATGLSLRSGDSVTADFRLARGAVITGVVTDADGRPEEGVLVAAYSYQFISGSPERRLSVASPYLRTDDRGMYRIYGLRTGEYVVGAQRGTSGAEPTLKPSTTDARNVTATPVYFPSATDVTAATWIKVAAGDERAGLDIQIRYVLTATVVGTVALPSGTTFARVVLARAAGPTGTYEPIAGTTTQPDGAFLLANVVPGHYTLFAVAQGPSAPGQPTPTSGAGTIGIDVDGEDVTGVSIPTSSPFSLSGTFAFDGADPPEMRLGRMTLPLALIGGAIGPTPYFQPVDDSHFTISALVPGTYRVTGATVPGTRAPLGKWWLKSIAIGGREALDGPIEIRQPSDEIVVTFGDQASAISGTVTGAQGSPLPNTFVVIFGADRASWFINSRRVAGVRTDAQGRYTIRNLPPGEYRAAVALDLDQGEWFDPDVLQGFLTSAEPVTITGVEDKALDLILR